MSNNKESRLASISLLEGRSDEEKRELEKRCRWWRYKANEQILDKDSNDRDVYFVAEGTVQIVNFSMTGREIALARLHSGNFFGELSAIDGQPRSASVVALEDCLLGSLSPQLSSIKSSAIQNWLSVCWAGWRLSCVVAMNGLWIFPP